MKPLIFAVLLLALSPLFTQEQPPGKRSLGTETRYDSIIATVNGEAITLLDILIESSAGENRLSVLYTGERLMHEKEALRKRCLDDIVTRKLAYAEYKKKPFEIQTQYVEDMIDHLAHTMGDGTRLSLERRARRMGTTMEEIRAKVREKIAVDAMLLHFCDRSVSVTPKEIYEEYRKRLPSLGKPEQLKLRMIQVLKEGNPQGKDPAKLRDEIADLVKNADEQTFGTIVKLKTDGPNASSGGSMGWVETHTLRPEFRQVLKNPRSGMIAGPAETADGWYFFRVDDWKKAEIPSYSSVVPALTEELRAKGIQAARKRYVEKISRDAVISYNF